MVEKYAVAPDFTTKKGDYKAALLNFNLWGY